VANAWEKGINHNSEMTKLWKQSKLQVA